MLKGRPLTEIEKLVIEWVCVGKTNQEIALILGKSTPTIKNQLQCIQEKLDCCNRASAAVKYTKQKYGISEEDK